MNSIATQLAETGYEFFGGGGLVAPDKAARSGDTSNDVWGLLDANGYTVLNNRASILELKTKPMAKVVAINPTLDGSQAMPYAIDKPADNLSLKEMTEVAIASLMGDSKRGEGKGFFLMVEGGKIDWACTPTTRSRPSATCSTSTPPSRSRSISRASIRATP